MPRMGRIAALLLTATLPLRAAYLEPSAPPQVVVDTGARNLVLDVAGSWRDVAFLGRPTLAARTLARVPITLVQLGKEEARVAVATPLCFSRSGGSCLPAGIILLSPCRPPVIQPRGAAALTVTVAGRNLPPGTYDGKIRIVVADQATPLEVPLQLRIKDGPLLALVALLTGLGASLLVRWFRDAGQAANEGTPRLRQGGGSVRIDWLRTAVVVVGWAFILVVGWIVVYVKSPTFGEDPMSYVWLALWGSMAEALRGTAPTLTKKGTAPAPE